MAKKNFFQRVKHLFSRKRKKKEGSIASLEGTTSSSSSNSDSPISKNTDSPRGKAEILSQHMNRVFRAKSIEDDKFINSIKMLETLGTDENFFKEYFHKFLRLASSALFRQYMRNLKKKSPEQKNLGDQISMALTARLNEDLKFEKDGAQETRKLTYLSEGSFNFVFTYEQDSVTKVLKIPKTLLYKLWARTNSRSKKTEPLIDPLDPDGAERAVRLYNQLNGGLIDFEVINEAESISVALFGEKFDLWISDLIEGKEASWKTKLERLEGWLEIDERLLLDAYVKDNVKEIIHDQKRYAVVIDPGQAIDWPKEDRRRARNRALSEASKKLLSPEYQANIKGYLKALIERYKNVAHQKKTQSLEKRDTTQVNNKSIAHQVVPTFILSRLQGTTNPYQDDNKDNKDNKDKKGSRKPKT